MSTQEFSTALNRWCKHNSQSARRCRCRCRQKPDAAQSPHTVNRRSTSSESTSYWHNIFVTLTLTLGHVITNPKPNPSRSRSPNPKQWAWPERACKWAVNQRNEALWLAGGPVSPVVTQQVLLTQRIFAKSAHFCRLIKLLLTRHILGESFMTHAWTVLSGPMWASSYHEPTVTKTIYCRQKKSQNPRTPVSDVQLIWTGIPPPFRKNSCFSA